MKKILLIIVITTFISGVAYAQNSSQAAEQSANLALSNSLEITYVETGNNNGNEAVMKFKDKNDFVNGVMSLDQELRVRSNKNFKIAVKCDGNSFAYVGNDKNNHNPIKNNFISAKVTANHTGGNVTQAFKTGFGPLSDVDQDLLVDGESGDDQTFKIMYKCAPGFGLPSGIYSMNVVFTATQQ